MGVGKSKCLCVCEFVCVPLPVTPSSTIINNPMMLQLDATAGAEGANKHHREQVTTTPHSTEKTWFEGFGL